MKVNLFIFLVCIAVAQAKLVMIIRHGEKISDEVSNLSPEGEARAKCLVNLFGVNGTYVSPQKIFAQNPTQRKRSTRPRDTVVPLAEALGLKVDLSYSCHKITKLVQDIQRSPEEVILVSWSKANIPEMARQLGVAKPPNNWGKSFDHIWMVSDGQTSYLPTHTAPSPSTMIRGNSTETETSTGDHESRKMSSHDESSLQNQSFGLQENQNLFFLPQGLTIANKKDSKEGPITLEIHKQNLEDCIHLELKKQQQEQEMP